MTQVLIYNLGGTEVLGKVSVRHAVGMLYRQVARVHTAVPGETVGPYPRPAAVELVNYVVTRWVYARTGKVMYSKPNLLARDRHTCAYCGKHAATVDHVTPRCQGGRSTWLNCVAACAKCNGRKKGRTPEQAGMRLRFQPFVPTTLAEVRSGR